MEATNGGRISSSKNPVALSELLSFMAGLIVYPCFARSSGLSTGNGATTWNHRDWGLDSLLLLWLERSTFRSMFPSSADILVATANDTRQIESILMSDLLSVRRRELTTLMEDCYHQFYYTNPLQTLCSSRRSWYSDPARLQDYRLSFEEKGNRSRVLPHFYDPCRFMTILHSSHLARARSRRRLSESLKLSR